MIKKDCLRPFMVIVTITIIVVVATYSFQRSILTENKRHQASYVTLLKEVAKQEADGRVFSQEFKEDLDLLSQVVLELDTDFDGFSSNLWKAEVVRDLLQDFNKQLR